MTGTDTEGGRCKNALFSKIDKLFTTSTKVAVYMLAACVTI
jgi:hypothetical protein